MFLGLLVASGFCATPIEAANSSRFLVRINTGLPVLQQTCTVLGCTVTSGLDGSIGQLYLVSVSANTPAAAFLAAVQARDGVTGAEPDAIASVASTAYTVPPSLYDSTPVTYFGTTVPHGYVNQPAAQIVGLSKTQTSFAVQGVGTVAVIDTGIDPNHPALRNSLVPGYDFTRNQTGEGDETDDISLGSKPYAMPSQASWTSPNIAMTDQSTAAVVDQSTAAVVDQSTAAVVDGNPQYSDFGHGTMVAGIIHLVAPGAMLMPLKAFSAAGTGYTSDMVRATYWAVQNHANIINMSFNLPGYSQEMANAVAYATLNGVICVAAAGNQGKDVLVYPAALKNVISVASTNNSDQRSTFSNYGTDLVWLAAPGEGIVTTYPFSTYAAGWGTSFSAPFVSGVASLMMDYSGSMLRNIMVFNDQSDGAKSVAHAHPVVDPTLNHGRLDTLQSVTAWRQIMGK